MGVALVVLEQDALEGLGQVDAERVAQTHENKHDISDLESEVALEFVRLLGFVAELMVQLAS
jgi:hypothetical protein